MEVSFYVLLVIACLVLVLVMWVCAASSTPKWGPDLTLELPPHLLQEALFRAHPAKPLAKISLKQETVPSAPSEMLCDPLLNNEHPMAMSNSTPKPYRPVLMSASSAVRVLPTHYVPLHSERPVLYTFSTEEPS